MLRLLQIGFWAAIAVTVFFTLRPITVTVPGSDKTHHLLTFAILMCLAAAAFPRRRLDRMAAALSVFGAGIEIAQPYFQRKGELLDWVADSVGILIALLLAFAVRKMLVNEPER